MPTDHNLRDEYEDFAALEQACEQFMAEVNTRPHRITRRPPTEMLGEEHEHLHRPPRMPHTLCFGQTRKVNWQSLISVGGAQYSVPHELIDERVWARIDGSELIVVHVDRHQGPKEVARHELTTPGRPAIRLVQSLRRIATAAAGVAGRGTPSCPACAGAIWTSSTTRSDPPVEDR